MFDIQSTELNRWKRMEHIQKMIKAKNGAAKILLTNRVNAKWNEKMAKS